MNTSATTSSPAVFEHRVVRYPKGKQALYQDTYRNFGWEADGAKGRMDRRMLGLHRDRAHRSVEVAQLQLNAESALSTINRLERSRTTAASVVAWVLGLVGAVLLAVAVFATQDSVAVSPGLASMTSTMVFSVGIGGLFAWALAPLAYRAIRDLRTKRLQPSIDRQYEVLAAACEAANRSLTA